MAGPQAPATPSKAQRVGAPGTTPANGEEKPKREKKAKVKRQGFVASGAAPKTLLNENGLLTDLPTTWDAKVHKPLRRSDFAAEHIFMGWRAGRLEAKAASLVEEAAALRREAEESKKIGDPEQRAKVRKAEKLRAQLAELEAKLKAAGVVLPPRAEATPAAK